jgi:2-polyprenyl-3-methyl-5-hydroxy-6-metoxy-1,4-benzoquinol methylase
MWMNEEHRADWTRPEQDVIGIIPLLRSKGTRKVLDMGCGIGRHSLFLASLGFEVCSLDASAAGLEITRSSAAKAGLSIECCLSRMTELPFEDCSFDYLLAWNVIYHGDLNVVERSLDEIFRILRPGGIFQGTMLSKRNALYQKGCLIAKDTFILNDNSEKDHPHYYCNADELVTLLARFDILLIRHTEQTGQGSYHWHFSGEKLIKSI